MKFTLLVIALTSGETTSVEIPMSLAQCATLGKSAVTEYVAADEMAAFTCLPADAPRAADAAAYLDGAR